MSERRAPSLRKLAGLPTESQLQAQIVQGLRLLGYVVLECGRYVRQTRCPGCGAWHTPRSGYGNARGTPDLLVADPSWGDARRHATLTGMWLGVELKNPAYATTLGTVPAGRLRPEQAALAEAGRIVVCRSLEEVLGALKAVDDDR